MIENEDNDIPQSKPAKVVVTSSGRVAKIRKSLDYYQEDLDEIVDDEKEDSSYYSADNKDEDYSIDSNEGYESDCLNYDIIKKQLLKTPDSQDITRDFVSVDRHKDDQQQYDIRNL